ncbi:MAG: dihydroorotase [Dehalococcoidia bacterium]|nr:dihydroorotase [Dehalococcoidia bacterium]
MRARERLLVKGGRILDPSQGMDAQADLMLEDGRVVWVAPPGERRSAVEGAQVLDASGLVVCPGFIDLHTHLREPGFEHKETITTGTLAAARGGFTTVCAMPNTDPPADSAAVVHLVLERARSRGHVRVLPIGCVSKGRKGGELAELVELAEAGVVAFSDDGAPVADAHLMRTALQYSSVTSLPVIQHCEEPSLANGGLVNEGWVGSRLGLPGVPRQAEEIMAARDIQLAALTGGRLHLAHVSTADAVDLVRRAKERGLRVTAEVTPHHLLLTEEWLLGTQGEDSAYAPLTLRAYDTACKVNPPLRTAPDTEALVAALRDGTIDAIATDHAPHAATDKTCTFQEAAFGISGLETAFGLLMRLVHAGRLPLSTLVERLTIGPASVLGERGKGLGTLRPGSPADVVLLDLNKEWTVDAKRFASKGKNTPLHGVTLKGAVAATIVGGEVAFGAQALTSTRSLS